MNVFDPNVFSPPKAFRRIELPSPHEPFVHSVRWCDAPRHPPKRVRGAKQLGLLYERRVLDVLEAIYAERFTPQAAIRYKVRGRRCVAILDGILRFNDEVIIIEVKLAHTVDVYPQLMLKYLPLVRALEPQRRPRTVEICRSYDPDVVLPGPHTLVTSLHRSPAEGAARPLLEVIQWKI